MALPVRNDARSRATGAGSTGGSDSVPVARRIPRPRLGRQTDGRAPPAVYDPDMRKPLKIDIGIAAVLLAALIPLVILTPGGPHSAPGLIAALGLSVAQ